MFSSFSVARNRAQLAAAGLVLDEARVDRVRFGPVYQRIDQYVVYRVQDRLRIHQHFERVRDVG